MRFDKSFRYADHDLNRLLQAGLQQASIQHRVDDQETIHYASADEERFENVLAVIRTQTFASWQVLSCPPDTVNQYRTAMQRRGVKYREEINDGKVEFLIPQGCRPHAWKLDDQKDRSPSESAT